VRIGLWAAGIGERDAVVIEDRLEHRRPEDIAARHELHVAITDAFGIARVALQYVGFRQDSTVMVSDHMPHIV
jgi:hypothetical protein